MVGLNLDKLEKKVTCAKNLTQNGDPQSYSSGNAEEEEELFEALHTIIFDDRFIKYMPAWFDALFCCCVIDYKYAHLYLNVA